MDLALAVLLLWGLLFVPLGIVLHWLVLGEGSRVRALPIAPLTGIAVGVVVMAALGRFDIDAGSQWLAWTLLAVSVACVVVIWRRDVEWRSRELIGAGAMLLFAVLLVQLPVIGDEGDGPLGYGTAANPVAEVAAIDVAAGGPAADLGVGASAQAAEDERPIGFEQFAAFTVGLGLDESPDDPRSATWSAYGLHSTITGMFAALVALPLFAFARARGVRWLGLAVLVPLGVLAPAVFLALANGEGAAVASVAFTTCAVFSLLVTRRDRGWWALLVLFCATIVAIAGPLALLPLLAISVAWMVLRSDTYEHLSQHDAPVGQLRTLVVTGAAAGLAGISTVPLLASGGDLLAWNALHVDLLDTVRSWPFAWLDSDLSTAGPEGLLETGIWLIGPALLAVAVIYAIVRNERRELGVLVGAIIAGLGAALVGLFELRPGIRLFEFTMLSLSPFLAALAIRAVALARENAEDVRNKGARGSSLAGVGPTVLVLAFVVLSFAATAVTGTRMVHAPSIDSVATAHPEEKDAPVEEGAPVGTIIAAGDPWLEFVVDGRRVPGGYADADAISEERGSLLDRGTRTTGYERLILSSSPLSSDPSLHYVEQDDLDRYQVRLFAHRDGASAPRVDEFVDPARLTQRGLTESADRPGTDGADTAADAADAAADGLPAEMPGDEHAGSAAEETADAAAGAGAPTATSVGAAPPLALAHHPVEGLEVNTPADRPAGLLLPSAGVPGCESSRDVLVDGRTCEPDEPVRGEGCTDRDVAAARAGDDRDRGRDRTGGFNRAQVLEVDPDPQLPQKPRMLGVQCFDVPLAENATVLLVHLRDIGVILPPEDAASRGPEGAWETEEADGRSGGVNGGTRRSTSELDAALSYGNARLGGGLRWDLVLEGSFGAGVRVTTGLSVEGEDTPDFGVTEIGTLRGSADGFSSIIRGVPLSGSVNVANAAGTDIELGRLFARPVDIPRSCDVLVGLEANEQREVRMDVRSGTGGSPLERPGLTVTVVDIDEDGSGRQARVAVGSYLSRGGLPRYTLVDWTEQFEGPTTVEGCDGAAYEEAGPDQADETVVLDEESLEAFAREQGTPFEAED